MFPLFTLPVLAVYEVFKSMDHREIFLASLLSNRTKRAIRAAIPKGSVHLTFHIKTELEVESENFLISTHSTVRRDRPALYGRGFERVARNATVYKFGSKLFRVGFQDYIIPEDVLDLMRRDLEPNNAFRTSMIHHFVETFSPIVSLNCQAQAGEIAVPLLRYFKGNNIEIKDFFVEFEPTTTEDFIEILNSCSNIDVLFICSYPPRDFQYRSPVPFTTRHVRLIGGWMKLDDFLQCKILEIVDMDIQIPGEPESPEKLNAFLKTWMATDCKLEKLWIVVVRGLSDRPIQEGESIEVQKANGRMFKIYVDGNHLRMVPVEAN